MSKPDYKAIAYFLVGVIVGCGFSHVASKFLNNVL